MNLPNIISTSRGIAAIAMLFVPVFSMPFWTLYCWGGVSDMIDGPIARKMNEVSEMGSRIDSIADLLFLVCSAIVLFPIISLPLWIWIWVGVIGFFKAACIIIKSYRSRIPEIPHSMMNKLTGFLLFCIPFSINTTGIFISSIIVCIVASVGVLTDITSLQNQRKIVEKS